MKQLTGVLLAGLSVVALSFSLGLPQAARAQETDAVPAPTILSPEASQITVQQPPRFAGVTANDTQVDVYIDGQLAGQARVKNSPNGTASWGYQAESRLDLGEHMVHTIARHKSNGLISDESAKVLFYLEEPFPAPTLLAPTIDERTNYDQPWINGVAVNGSLIDIYIDGQLDGTVQVADNQSGTAKFEYQPKSKLLNGWHSVTATAQDKRGKESISSNAIVFELKGSQAMTNNSAPQLAAPAPGRPAATPAPTLIEPQFASVTTLKQPLVSGLARNGQSVEIFIDGTLNGEISARNHESGVYAFSYKPFLPLPPGAHSVYSRAMDGTGSKSTRSNSLNFIIRPDDSHMVVSPDGVSQTKLSTTPGSVSGLSTGPDQGNNAGPETSGPQSEITEEAATDEMEEKATDTPDDELAMPENPGDTNEPLTEPETGEDEDKINVDTDEPTNEVKVTENQDSDASEPISVISGDTGDGTEVVVVGQKNTTTAAASNNESNTILVIVLAIAAIIIIGLISWYTSREEHEEPDGAETSTPAAVEPERQDADHKPIPGTQDVWEEEPVETDSTDYSLDSDDNIPPPPPPPALGL